MNSTVSYPFLKNRKVDFPLFKSMVSNGLPILVEFLRKFDTTIPEGIEAIVAQAENATWAAIDCTHCAGCCKSMTPVFTDKDISRISQYMNLNIPDFEHEYIELEADTGNKVIKEWPCALLKNNLCTIYSVRPDDCAGFPHLDKRPFDEYNETHIQNVDKCPATFVFVNLVKQIVEQDYEF